ncbi:MAG TPA: hypothetical protein VGH20_21345 [Myxococcales bacterium]|jgi:hypothetical protein
MGDKLEKATLTALKPDLTTVDDSAKDKTVTVQFNPDTLKISLANAIQQPEGGGDKRGTPGQLFVGAGTSKLSCTLWFDVTAAQSADPNGAAVDDVRTLTGKVAWFITPLADKKDPKKFVPPGVRFLWGSLQFNGVMEGLEESLELFSPEGRPLRASVGITLSQQKIIVLPPKPLSGGPQKAPGITPTTPVPQGSPVQKVAGSNWQGVAQANGIENPRLPPAGARLDLTVTV